MNYSQLLHLLATRGNELRGIHLGLDRITAMMRALGSPHRKYAILHVAGTNGKGSVAAMSESILRAAGYKTGLYTSPHLERVQERIRVSGRDISAAKIAAVAGRIRRKEAKLHAHKQIDIPLTYFEFLTACAFLHFALERVEVAVLEVGLGGRLDATNIARSQASIITGIAADHEDILGPTLAEIAKEKAGIIKAGVPVVSGCRSYQARQVIRAQARRTEAPLLEIDRDCRTRIVGDRGGTFTIDLTTPRGRYTRLPLPLAGLHQARNAALAVAGVESLEDFPVTPASIRSGLARTRWRGRLEEYSSRRRTLLEGAHNPEGARALHNHLVRCESGEIHLVFGALQDKDIGKMGRLLFPLARSIHLTPVANARSFDPRAIAAAHPRFRGRMSLHRKASSALLSAWSRCPRQGVVVVTGSLYLLGELLPVIRAAEVR